MRKFKRKGRDLVVEAGRVGTDDINEMANWSRAYVVEEKDALTHDIFEALNVRTSKGMERASHGMYVVRIGSEFFVTNHSSFEREFEPIETPEEENPIQSMYETVFRKSNGSRRI